MTVGITHEAVHLVEPSDDIGLSVGYRGIVRGEFGDIYKYYSSAMYPCPLWLD